METQSVSTSLGLTQKELAILLRVTRTQISMFELGKRSLPLHAMQLLGELLTLSKSSGTATKDKPILKGQSSQRQEQIKVLLKENEFQLYIVAKKLAAAERKTATQLKLIRFTDYLEQRPTAKANADVTNMQFITHKSAKAFHTDAAETVIKYQLRQELLEVEKKYLESLQKA